MKKHILVTLICVLFASYISFAQETQNEPLFYQKSKASANLTNSSNLLKTDIVSIIGGELPFIWEHKFSKSFGIELGAGVLLPYYVNTDISFIGKTNFSNDKFGYSALASIKTTPFWFADENFYSDFGLHYRCYSTGSLTNLMLGSGYQWQLFDKLSLDLGLHIGFLIATPSNSQTEFYYNDPGMNFCFNISLKIGYILN